MERFSVKKPFTVLVAVIAIIALGFVSLSHLTMDLLPEMNLPYLIVVTTYPGASPDKVEAQVTIPIESSLGTISGVENVSSTSSENYSMVQLEFADGTDMNSAIVKVSGAINQLQGVLPEDAGTPSIMEISLDMLATMYVAVEVDGYDIYQLTDFVNNDVIPYISRVDGVASITTVGLVEQSIQVELNQDKIDEVNDRILMETNERLADAQEMLDDANEQLEEAQAQLDDAQSSFGGTMSSAVFLSQNADATLADLQATADQAAADLNAAADAQDQMAAALADAQASYDEISAALEAANNDPSTDFNSPEYQALLTGVQAASDSRDQAAAQYGVASDEYAAAQAAYDEASAALTAATLQYSGADAASIAALQADIDTISANLEALSSGVDGSSFSNLVVSTRDIASAVAQASSIIERVRSIDALGSMSASLGNTDAQLATLSESVSSIPQMLDGLEAAASGFTQAQLDAAVGFSTAAVRLSDARTALDQAQAQYDDAREQALENANIDQLISASTLSQIIYAQNFAMPVGYIDDENDESWLLKVGEGDNRNDKT